MSPPVLGTLLGLCITMILPNRGGNPPVAGDKAIQEVPRPLGRRGGEDGEDTSSDSQTSIKLVHKGPGLFGIFLYNVPAFVPNPPHCGTCLAQFVKREPVFAWKTRDNLVLLLHEGCMVAECECANLQGQPFRHCKELLMKTDNATMLESLFAIEDALTPDSPWEIVDCDDDGKDSADSPLINSESEDAARPQKARRCDG